MITAAYLQGFPYSHPFGGFQFEQGRCGKQHIRSSAKLEELSQNNPCRSRAEQQDLIATLHIDTIHYSGLSRRQ